MKVMKNIKMNFTRFIKLFFVVAIIFVLNSVFVLASSEPPISISGKISGASVSGMSLGDISIEVSGTTETKVKTDRFGNYIIRNLPKGGTYTIKPSKQGFNLSPASRTYRGLMESKINEDYIISGQTFSISGKVLAGGKPVKGITVMINNRNNKYFTNQDGVYNIDHLEYGGSFKVSVISDSFNYESFVVDFLDKDIVHDFTKDIVLSGYITSFDRPVKDLEIKVNGIKYKTDSNGKYMVKGVSAGVDYKIILSNSDIVSNPAYISLTKLSNDKDNLNFDVSATISGKVTYNNAPFKDAMVKINEFDKMCKTDSKGEFKFSSLDINNEYNISVSSVGYSFTPSEWKIKNLKIEKNKNNFVASVKKYKATITAKKGSNAISGAAVTILETKKTLTTDTNGKCIFDNLKYGAKYTVSIKKEGNSFIEPKQQIEIKTDKDLELVFNSALAISGSVKKDSKPIANALIVCGEQKVKSKADGSYTINNLKPNVTYNVSVSSGSLVFEKNNIVLGNLSDSKTNVNFIAIDNEKKEEEQKKLAKEAEIKAQEEAKKNEEKIKLAKEEQEKLAKEAEIKAQEEAKKNEEKIKLAKEEQEKLAKEEKIKVQEEARIKLETDKAAKEAEIAKMKAEKEEKARLAKEEKMRAQEEARLKLEADKAAKEAEIARIKAEKEEKARLAKEEKMRAQEEAKKKALEKEEQAKLIKEEKIKAQEEAKKKEEELKAAKEAEIAKVKAEKEEKARLAKEEKMRAQEEARLKLEADKAAKEAEIAKMKEEKERLAKEAELKAQEEAKKKAEVERAAKEREEAKFRVEKENKVSIKGRVLKGKEGIPGVQVRVLTEEEEKIFITDKNGFYKVPNLVKGENYTLTVISGKTEYDLSPKVKVYKKISESLTNQNFYVIEDHTKILEKSKETNNKDNFDSKQKNKEGEWYDDYGIQKKNGMLQKQI